MAASSSGRRSRWVVEEGVKSSPDRARWLIAAVIGGVACVVGDHLHVTEGVLFYPSPVLWQQAWWVFPLFFFATLAVIAGARLIIPRPPEGPGSPIRIAVGDFFALLIAYAFTAFEHTRPNVVLCVLVALWMARVLRGMPPREIVFCLLIALGGTSWEAMWSGIGMFTYHHPDFLGVPRWLPALYLHAGIAGASARRVVVAS
jgi:hypothetical protein